MEKLAEMYRTMGKITEITMKKIAEIFQNRHQVALLLPNGLIEVISSEGTYFFLSMSAMAKHSIGNRIKTDEIIDLTFSEERNTDKTAKNAE